jgi:hypothetical protein
VQSFGNAEKTLPLAPGDQSKLEVELIPEPAISAEGKELIAAAKPEIRRRAEIDSFDFDHSRWNVEQIACSAFPHSLVLRYTAGKSPRQRSEFIASIARAGGEVRFIPVQRKGYSPYSPMPGNVMTIGAINTMLEREDAKPHVSQIAVCYAAFVGAAPQTGNDGRSFVRLEVPPVIRVPVMGDETVLLTTGGIPPQDWTLEFDPGGKLLKAEEEPVAMVIRKVPPLQEPKGKPVPPATEPAVVPNSPAKPQ